MRDLTHRRARWALGLYILCFSIGALNHARDFVRFGWRPYRWGSTPLELFWTSLIVLDVAVVGLLVFGRRRLGLGLALTVMTLDVAANAYALLRLVIPGFTVPLLLQTAFFGFIIGSIGFLWPPRQPQIADAPQAEQRLM